MEFEFSTAERIIFGRGKVDQIGKLAKKVGSHALVITGKTPERFAQVFDSLSRENVEYSKYSINNEPRISDINQGIAFAREESFELIIAIGGGSVIDAGKAVACLTANEGDLVDYLEVVGRGRNIPKPGLKMFAIPTTAGTGSEVTKNSVISVPEHKVKVSIRSPHLLPNIAIIDPYLSSSMPPQTTANSGMDALTQLIEPFVSKSANPLIDALCLQGIKNVGESLLNAFRDGEDMQAREKMALASLFSGFALANAQLGAVHGFAGVIGGMFSAPHGAVCAALLTPVMRVNVKSIMESCDADQLQRYEKISEILTGGEGNKAQDGIDYIWDLCNQLQIPSLSDYGINEESFPEIIVKAAKSSSMGGNPVDLSPDELHSILTAAL